MGAAREGVSEQCTCGGVRRVRVTALQYCTERVLARFTRRLGFLARRSEAKLVRKERKKERKQTTQGRDGRTVHRHHTGISRRGQCGASRHLPLGACLFLSLFAVCRRFSLQPSCHPAVFLLSSFSLLPEGPRTGGPGGQHDRPPRVRGRPGKWPKSDEFSRCEQYQ